MKTLLTWLALWTLTATASAAERGPSGSQAGAARPARAVAQKVRIGSPKRSVTIPERALRSTQLGQLPASRHDLRAGLTRYRSIRWRARELAHRSDALRLRPLAKVNGLVIDRLDFRAPAPADAPPRPKVLVVGGVHAGSERVGVESAMRFAEALGARPELLDRFDITVVPLANPTAMAVRSRRNQEGVDVNRAFQDGHWVSESRALAGLMKRERYDMVLDLHGAGPQRTGFFVIRGAEDRGLAQRFVRALPSHLLLDERGAGRTYALDAPGVVTSANQGTLKQFGVATGTSYSYTFEAPARLSAKTQVEGTLTLLRSALEQRPAAAKARSGF